MGLCPEDIVLQGAVSGSVFLGLCLGGSVFGVCGRGEAVNSEVVS